MKKIFILLLLTSCSSTFRGSFLDVEELSFEPYWENRGKKVIVRETMTQDEDATSQK